MRENDAKREERKEGRCVGLHNISPQKNPNSLKIHPNTHTHLDSFEMCFWRIMETISRLYRLRNDEVLQKNKKRTNLTYKKGKLTG